MRIQFCKRGWIHRLISAVLLGITVGGCSAPSLLITPVTSRRELVETELSSDSFWAGDKIALIDVSGVIMNSREPRLFAEGEQPVSLFLEELEHARRDPRVKAVILRINSPGGTVVASELMHDELTHFRKSGKPVIAVMMDVAASGGYYLACGCDEIFAQPSTITGSIGVIMQMFDLTGTMKLVGVHSEAITSGELKDAGSPFREMKPHERELFQNVVNDMFERFVAVVKEGRPKLDEETVRRLADGRIYTANQALEAGLIDGIASMREAFEITKKRVNARRAKLVTYHRPIDYRPNYYARTPVNPGGDVNLLKLDWPTWLEAGTPQFMYLWRPGL